jgi:hypothetical protein
VDSIERFYALDAMRGLAALSVVFWHWPHFFFTGTSPGEIDLALPPALSASTIPACNRSEVCAGQRHLLFSLDDAGVLRSIDRGGHGLLSVL